ncbi:uncharacterized protein LOC116844843 isoform X2 [Odontomachus brunneus]|uniref:uncharacterized protein LOC116844843 isoform X2 n=1 Tax=Odontomachus brunneus TaxID=486640 RepID=UPI0013F29491|nr:uncharacterized protein LOC116844843 isoform X2 [Odontomachus brunneus]
MLCCVPKRLADGGPFYDEASTTPPSVHEIQFELYPEEDAPPPILLPCAICARTFMPQSLEKHTRICERTAVKKRKPFDSAKQRIQGTELAEFLPKQETRRHQDERSRTISPTWKKTHDDFLRVIREARGEVMNSRNKQCNSLSSSGAPTRANEKGTCPTCNRQFGIKAYDRHVAWCKDRVISVPVSPAVNLAKERLEARMRYRAPVLKNRRAATREKYSPTSAGNQCKISLSAPALVKPKESVSMSNCSRESPNKQKPAVVRRPGQLKESPISSGPMKSRLADRTNNGTCKDYDPFLLAEQQMNDLLSDTSDQSMIGSSKPQTRDNLYPLSHSSAFVKYPRPTNPINPDKRTSLIAPPSEFDDLISDFSSDSTETNSISREIFLKDLSSAKDTADLSGLKPVRELGRRLIIDKTKALGSDLIEERRGVIGSADKARKNLDTLMPKIVSKTTRPLINRSNSIRASSAPRSNASSDGKVSSDTRKVAAKSIESRRSSDQSLNQRNNNYSSLSGSNLSLSSIVSSEMDIKRSNSVFDELMTSFEEDISFPTLRSYLNNESFDVSSSMLGDGQRNGIVSDEELSSPDSYKPQDHSKLSNDSAYSSLNRKYSHHGRSTNDVVGRLDEDVTRNETPSQTIKCKMSKFCHECGLRFPENAKFCCECGVRRLAL